MKIIDRYASAIRSSNLKGGKENDDFGDPEVLGAYGIADRRLTNGEDCGPSPLSVPLERLLMGDNTAGEVVVIELAKMAWKRARHMKVKCQFVTAQDLARACLAWHRNGTCSACGGHGRLKIPGTNVIGASPCKACRPYPGATEGTGRVPFDRAIQPPELRDLAGWMVSEMDRALGRAGPAAMKALMPRLDL